MYLDDSVVRHLRSSASEWASTWTGAFTDEAEHDRFELDERVGAGGMGEVFRREIARPARPSR